MFPLEIMGTLHSFWSYIAKLVDLGYSGMNFNVICMTWPQLSKQMYQPIKETVLHVV